MEAVGSHHRFHFARMTMKAISPWVNAGFILLLVGCSRGDLSDSTLRVMKKTASDKAPGPTALATPTAANEPAGADWAHDAEFVVQKEAGEKPMGGAANQAKPPAKVARKIKHTADLKLITDEFDKTRVELQKLIEKHQGYEALADIRTSPGAQRVGTWRVRVPLENFVAFRDAARKLAEMESDTVNTEDLTDQYYDLDANIKNLKAE